MLLPDWHHKYHCMNLVLVLCYFVCDSWNQGERGEERIGCVLIQLTSSVALHPPLCCMGLVSKKDNFLTDSIDVMQTDLSGDD